MMISKIPTHGHNALTLVELLVAMMVTSIILTAVAALAFALGAANDSSNDTAQKQALVRYATLRISELIKHCKLICGTPGNDMVIWKADENDDGRINAGELVYIKPGLEKNRIRLLEFSARSGSFAEEWFANHSFTINDIKSGGAKVVLSLGCKNNYTNLIPQSSNVEYLLDTDAPQTRFVGISFDLEENDAMHRYQINASLRAWAGNLLDSSGEIVNRDDD